MSMPLAWADTGSWNWQQGHRARIASAPTSMNLAQPDLADVGGHRGVLQQGQDAAAAVRLLAAEGQFDELGVGVGLISSRGGSYTPEARPM